MSTVLIGVAVFSVWTFVIALWAHHRIDDLERKLQRLRKSPRPRKYL